jgi:hypothetical protein
MHQRRAPQRRAHAGRRRFRREHFSDERGARGIGSSILALRGRGAGDHRASLSAARTASGSSSGRRGRTGDRRCCSLGLLFGVSGAARMRACSRWSFETQLARRPSRVEHRERSQAAYHMLRAQFAAAHRPRGRSTATGAFTRTMRARGAAVPGVATPSDETATRRTRQRRASRSDGRALTPRKQHRSGPLGSSARHRRLDGAVGAVRRLGPDERSWSRGCVTVRSTMPRLSSKSAGRAPRGADDPRDLLDARDGQRATRTRNSVSESVLQCRRARAPGPIRLLAEEYRGSAFWSSSGRGWWWWVRGALWRAGDGTFCARAEAIRERVASWSGGPVSRRSILVRGDSPGS